MPMIRTVFQPDTPREVDEHEAAQLKREGLLLPLDEPGPEVPLGAAATAPAPKAAVEAAPAATPVKEVSPGGDKAQ